MKTIAAFANDLQNLNGEYIIIGVNEHEGCAVMPPCGIAPAEIDVIQKWVRGYVEIAIALIRNISLYS